jgi:choline dehydrogenase-like flavoprotein
VILSAGAIGSPHILQLSGVGDPEHLAKIGVPVVHEARGVGRNVQDHYTARVSYPVVGAQTANERSRGLPLAGEVLRWVITGKGMLTYSPSIVAASVKVLEESATPDVQVTFAPGSFKGGQIGELEETQRRRMANAAVVARLCRGQVEPAGRHAGDHLDQHQRADHHDRREGRGDHQRRRAAKDGGVVKPGGGRKNGGIGLPVVSNLVGNPALAARICW